MELIVNGEPYELEGEKPTIADLVEDLGLGRHPAAVEVNQQFVPKREHASTALTTGDRVEVVTLVGGG
ncbi:MAG: sulfur carrier protein ThiS [Phycisphaerae bacterium]|nr:sulfur carrier protein ThiS [Phycisphaerae bacterium]